MTPEPVDRLGLLASKGIGIRARKREPGHLPDSAYPPEWWKVLFTHSFA